ncbi:MAG: hypothetical protein WD934_08180 [Gemmatimonadales bacterium]
MTDRRAFLKTLARSAAYAAPVVMSYAVPSPLAGQGASSQHHSTSAGTQTETTSPYSPPPGRREPTPLP